MSEEKIKGVFFERKHIAAGTMGTSRVSKESTDLHYYLKSNSEGKVDVLYLKPDGTPTAIVMETIEMDEFQSRFNNCSDHECDLRPKSEKELLNEQAEARVNVADRHFEKKEFHAAAFEYGQAAKVEDQNLKAHLGKGKSHMELGEVDKAKESFETLSNIDTLFEEDNKHIFNEYGIELRKGAMYDMAIENYTKAISIDPNDEALYYNKAKALNENGDKQGATQALEKALSIDSEFQEAKALLNHINKANP